MIIFLTGTTGSGKTDTAWALLSLHSELVFLESDFLGYRKPFDWRDKSDLTTMYEQLLMNVEFHYERGAKNFVITLTPHMAVFFPKMRSRFQRFTSAIYPFRLVCEDSEVERRIRERGRGDIQTNRELGFYAEGKQLLDDAYPDDGVFTRIESVKDDELGIAKRIMNWIDRQKK